jgi:hypothetical protein
MRESLLHGLWRVRIDAWYSQITFRRRPIGVVLVGGDRSWGRVETKSDSKMHPSAAQFVASQVGAIRKKIEGGNVPRKADLDFLSEKFSGDVRMSAPMPIISGEAPEEMLKRIWKQIADQSSV